MDHASKTSNPPGTIRALVLTRRPNPGSLPDVIEMAQIASPAPRRREVIVRVLASSINIDDIHVAEGTFYGGIPIGAQPRPDRPVTPGCDVAGIAAAVGREVRSIRVGEAVFGVVLPFRARGAWEEACPVDERWLTRKPEQLSFGIAAACGVSGLVAHSAIHSLQLRAGMRIVIVGATGGIGGMAVQLAVRAGATVIGVCSSAHSERAYALGCSLVLDYHGEPWDRALIAKREAGIDRVLDVVGGRDIEEAGRRVLGKEGIFVTVVGPERFIGDRALGWSGVVADVAHIGYRLLSSRIRGPRYVLTGPGLSAGKALAEVAGAAMTGVIPPIDSTVPFELEAIRQALRRAAAHRNGGRIVIQMDKAA
jgi:NADPH:quinone reductase-like Zn-dependent oxidoreductase